MGEGVKFARLVLLAACALGAFGWVSEAVEMYRAPSSVPVTVLVTKESFDHAHGLCAKYMDPKHVPNGVVTVFTLAGENVVLPCRVVLERESNDTR